jgi:hypothetical protein
VACAAALVASPLSAFAQPATPVTGLPLTDAERSRTLPTDGLVDPPPAIPPRSSYQRPMDPSTGTPNPPNPLDLTLPEGAVIPLPSNGGGRIVSVAPRYGRLGNAFTEKLPDDSKRAVYVGGVIIFVGASGKQPATEFAADSAVIWETPADNTGNNNPPGAVAVSDDQKGKVEVFLSGNVIIRTTSTLAGQGATQTLRADQVYYDVTKNRAIALSANLEINSGKIPDGVYISGKEIRRLGELDWEILSASTYSSKLPADPGLSVDSPRISLQEVPGPRRNVFGLPYRTFDGKTIDSGDRIMTLRNGVTWLGGVPVFYTPYYRADANEPLGPLQGFSGGTDRIFGYQFYTTWDMYKLLALSPPQGDTWRLHLDYLSYRGPAAGTDFSYVIPNHNLPDFPGAVLPPDGKGFIRLYGIDDHGPDVIGGGRGPEPDHPEDRGRFQWQHQQEILEGLYFQGQIAYLSDKNFLEQYYKNEMDTGPNQETFLYATYQKQNLWASGLVMPKLGRDWETQTEWFPKVDGAVVGQSLGDYVLYNARGDISYAQLRPPTVNPGAVLPTEKYSDTGRLDFRQEISVPFALGPVKLSPYGVLDLTDYTADLDGTNAARVYGAGGLRGSVPLSHLYDGVTSELFNVSDLYHKVVIGANYYYARTNIQYSQLPQLDQLNDDNINRTYNNIVPYQTQFVSGPAGIALATSPLFNYQQYAIRRLVDNEIDTLGDVEVIQGDIRQRLQTKRGYPGMEHTVDLLTLDVSASYFPNAARDNYGKPFGFIEYNGQWNPGDRVSVLSSGWFDPFQYGASYWNLGVSVDRPDRTSFYLGYRQTDPLNSKEVTASIGYQLSRRYYMNVGASYDFGIQAALSNSLTVTRTGSDLTVSVGFTYNALVNNFGFQFLIIPNIIQALSPGKFGGLTPGMLGR